MVVCFVFRLGHYGSFFELALAWLRNLFHACLCVKQHSHWARIRSQCECGFAAGHVVCPRKIGWLGHNTLKRELSSDWVQIPPSPIILAQRPRARLAILSLFPLRQHCYQSNQDFHRHLQKMAVMQQCVVNWNICWPISIPKPFVTSLTSWLFN